MLCWPFFALLRTSSMQVKETNLIQAKQQQLKKEKSSREYIIMYNHKVGGFDPAFKQSHWNDHSVFRFQWVARMPPAKFHN